VRTRPFCRWVRDKRSPMRGGVPAFVGMTGEWVPAFAGMTGEWVPAGEIAGVESSRIGNVSPCCIT
jgi:hypothetical protein